jgi:general secretion pathway protein A
VDSSNYALGYGLWGAMQVGSIRNYGYYRNGGNFSQKVEAFDQNLDVNRQLQTTGRCDCTSPNMYLDFFGFTDPPFNLTPDSRFLFLSERHREALASLEYGVSSRKGFIVLTGEIGAGKTTLCRSLFKRLGENTHVALILNSYLTDLEMLQTINDELGVTCRDRNSKKALIDDLNVFLLEMCAQGHDVLVVIDEAQNLAPETLEQVRMLSNLETETDKLIQILLMGQPELRDTLRLPQLEQLNQRITVRYHLGPLNRDEVKEYLDHRMKVAGENNKAEFDAGAVERLFSFSHGIPRKMNLVSDRALLAAYAEQSHTVTANLVDQAIEEVAGSLEEEDRLAARPAMAASGSLAVGGGGVVAASPSVDPMTASSAAPAPIEMLHQAPGQAAPAQIGAPQSNWGQSSSVFPQPGFQPGGYQQSSFAGYPGQPSTGMQPIPQQASAGRGVFSGLLLGILGTSFVLVLAVAALAIFQPSLFSGLFNNEAPATAPSRDVASVQPQPEQQLPPVQPQRAVQQPAPQQPEPQPTPTAAPPTPVPTPTATPLPPEWSVDARGMIRTGNADFARLAVELALLRQAFDVKINTQRIAHLSPSLLRKLRVTELPELKERGLLLAELDLKLDDAIELEQPFLMSVRPKERMDVSRSLLLYGADPDGKSLSIGDPKHGVGRLSREGIERIYRGATFFFFDEHKLLGLKAGDEGDRVMLLQRLLQAAGTWKSQTDSADGTFGLSTLQAIQDFQRGRSLDITGEVDTPTLFWLMNSGLDDVLDNTFSNPGPQVPMATTAPQPRPRPGVVIPTPTPELPPGIAPGGNIP